MAEEVVKMSRKEVDRLSVIQSVVSKQPGNEKRLRSWGVTVRQVKRLVRRYRESDAAGLVSRRRGSVPTMRWAPGARGGTGAGAQAL